MNSSVVTSRPVDQSPGSHVAPCNRVVHTTDGAILFCRIMHGIENSVVWLADKTVINLRHLAVNIDQYSRLDMEVGRIGVKFPSHVLANISASRRPATRSLHWVLTTRREEPELK